MRGLKTSKDTILGKNCINIKTIISVIVLFTLFSCKTNNQQNAEKEILINIFPEIIDEIISENNTKKKIVFLQGKVAGKGLLTIINSNLEASKGKPEHELIKGLDIIKNDSLNVDFLNNIKTKKGYIFLTKDNEIKKALNENINVFAQLNMSNLYIDLKNNKGVIYCFYQAVNKVSEGYLVFINKNVNNKWIIDKKVLVLY